MAKAAGKILTEEAKNGISEERIQELRKAAQEEAKKELLAKREKEILEQFLKEERINLQLDDDHDMVTFSLDLAPNASTGYISLDGRRYYSNRPDPYTLPRRVFNTLMEIQANGWRHEAEIKGKPRNTFEVERAKFPNRVTFATDLQRPAHA